MAATTRITSTPASNAGSQPGKPQVRAICQPTAALGMPRSKRTRVSPWRCRGDRGRRGGTAERAGSTPIQRTRPRNSHRCTPVAAASPGAAPGRVMRALLPFTVAILTAYLACGPTVIPYDGDIMLRVTQSLVNRHSFQIVDPVFHLNQPYSSY